MKRVSRTYVLFALLSFTCLKSHSSPALNISLKQILIPISTRTVFLQQNVSFDDENFAVVSGDKIP